MAHESMMARQERTIKRLWILCIILIALFVGTNAAWIYYENSFEDIVVTQESEANDGGSAIVNNGGDFNYYGESKTNN